MKQTIGFNIWDDYYDDGYAPEGEIQETYAYCEEYDLLDEQQREQVAKVVYDCIMTLDMSGVTVEYADEQVCFEHLTHVRREKLVKELNEANLTFQGLPIHVYSES